MTSNIRGSSNDVDGQELQPLVCVEFVDCEKLRKDDLQNVQSPISVGTKRMLDGLISPPKQLLQSPFQFLGNPKHPMGRHMRALQPDENTPVFGSDEKKSHRVKSVKTSGPVRKNTRALRMSTAVNAEVTKKATIPSPEDKVHTPTTRSRSLSRCSITKEKAVATRRLLPTTAGPKTCPRVVKDGSQRSVVPSASSNNELSSASSPEYSPRKRGVVATPTTRSRSKNQPSSKVPKENVAPHRPNTRKSVCQKEIPKPVVTRQRLSHQIEEDPDFETPIDKHISPSSNSELSSASSPERSPRKRSVVATPTTRSKSRNQASSKVPKENVAPRRPSTRKSVCQKENPKPTVTRQLPTHQVEEDHDFESPIGKPVRRRGRPLLKTGKAAKTLKHLPKSPDSWSSCLEEEDAGDVNEHILVRALNCLHISKEEFSRQVKDSSKAEQKWAPLGREPEANEICNFISEHLRSQTSGSLFVAGVPGIGKSATIGAVLERLSFLSNGGGKAGNLPRFRLVTVNGFHFATPSRFYCEVHRQLTKSVKAVAHRGTASQQKAKRSLGPKAALETLNAYFSGKSSIGGVLPTVLVVDEMDALVSATSANQISFGSTSGGRRTASFGANRVLYNLLEWASTPVSRLIIVAVANTLDLPERALPLRVVSRMGLHRLAFMPYTHFQLETIVRARLSGLSEPVFDTNDAVLLAARKVAMASGDARRVLELCRLAIERALRQSRQVVTMQDVMAASESLSSATSRLALVRQVALSWRRVLTALVNVCRMQCRDHGACLVREMHAEMVEMWREEGGFCRPSDVEVIRIVGQMVACGLLAAEDVSHLGIQAHVQLTMPLPDLAAVLASLLGTNGP